MIPPIEIECPTCKAAPGKVCRTRDWDHDVYHHASRIDAAALLPDARSLSASTRVARHQELSDVEVDSAAIVDLRDAYKKLRDHHIAETSVLAARVSRMRRVYEAAVDWRRYVTLVAANPYTQLMINAIDAAIDAEGKQKQPGTHTAECAKARDHAQACDCHLAGNYR